MKQFAVNGLSSERHGGRKPEEVEELRRGKRKRGEEERLNKREKRQGKGKAYPA